MPLAWAGMPKQAFAKIVARLNPDIPSLRAGEGLCGIIHNRAGKHLETYCRILGEHEHGDAVITSAFNLPPTFLL